MTQNNKCDQELACAQAFINWLSSSSGIVYELKRAKTIGGRWDFVAQRSDSQEWLGIEINESLLWQYVEYRHRKGGRGTRELRPGSYLVCPELNPARRSVLREINVDWVQMTADELEGSVLAQLSLPAATGRSALRAKTDSEVRRTFPQLVSELASEDPLAKTEYLLGQEPTWADIHTGRAVERDCDKGLWTQAQAILEGKSSPKPMVITGTAGSGKSSSLMRLAIRLSADGIPVYWADEESNFQFSRLGLLVKETEGPLAIFVDDSDLFGGSLSGWAREIPLMRSKVLFAAAIRSNRLDGLLDKETLGGIEPYEYVMPPLEDSDIEALIKVLDEDNRLGILKGMSHQERVEAFQKEAGRQLLVAMIQATSGRLFREKIIEEFSQLNERQRLVYAIICLVSSQRYKMDREEILLASGAPDNQTLNALETLASRYLVFRRDIHSGYGARHRVIADEVLNAMQFRAMTEPVLEGVCFAFASKVSPDLSRTSRPWRRLIRFMNHDFISRITSAEVGRGVYNRLEEVLHWDYHYWLQRGSLEVEQGDLDLATNFLDQARSLAPDERRVQTEYAYLLMKKAAKSPGHSEAGAWFEDGRGIIEGIIESHGKQDYYPYHVLGSQGLAWARQVVNSKLERRELLACLLDTVRSGLQFHPKNEDLRVLAYDLNKELLMTAAVDVP